MDVFIIVSPAVCETNSASIKVDSMMLLSITRRMCMQQEVINILIEILFLNIPIDYRPYSFYRTRGDGLGGRRYGR